MKKPDGISFSIALAIALHQNVRDAVLHALNRDHHAFGKIIERNGLPSRSTAL
jgi:hypothetical protein